MKPKLIPLLERCIETGIELGWSRAFKHDDMPSEETIKTKVAEAIWSEIEDWFDFDTGRMP